MDAIENHKTAVGKAPRLTVKWWEPVGVGGVIFVLLACMLVWAGCSGLLVMANYIIWFPLGIVMLAGAALCLTVMGNMPVEKLHPVCAAQVLKWKDLRRESMARELGFSVGSKLTISEVMALLGRGEALLREVEHYPYRVRIPFRYWFSARRIECFLREVYEAELHDNWLPRYGDLRRQVVELEERVSGETLW